MSTIAIINHPSSVVTHLAPEGGIYGGEQLAERRKRIRSLASPLTRVMCHHIDANILEIFPDMMLDAGPGLIKFARVRDRMSKNPLLAVQMLLSSFDETQPMLERIVLTSGEATTPLLLAIDEGRIKPRGSREQYERVLIDQPWWGMRYLSTQAPDAQIAAIRANFAKHLTKACAERHKVSPQAALVHLFLHSDMDPQPFASILSQDPMVAYVASRLLGARGLNLRVDQVQNLDARWATHIALWGGFEGGNVDARIEDAIVTHAAWTGEYIARSENKHRDWNWVKGLYDRMEAAYRARGSTDPDLWADLLWAMLDRICLQVEGKEPRITLQQSYERHAPAQPPETAKAEVAPSAADSAFADAQN